MRQWENETPPGGLTELYVFKQDSKTVWPDEKLGPTFSNIDPRCTLPGSTGPAEFLTAPATSGNKEPTGKSPFIQVVNERIKKKTSALKANSMIINVICILGQNCLIILATVRRPHSIHAKRASSTNTL